MTEDGMLVAVGFPPEIELKGRKHRTTRRDGTFHQSFTIHYLLKFNHHHFQSESGAGDQIQSGASSGNLKKST